MALSQPSTRTPLPDERQPWEIERARLQMLHRFAILDTPAEEMLDRIVRLAATLFDTPIATLSLVDERRQWFKARIGLGASESPREIAFCDHTIRGEQVMVVPDTRKDPRFRANPLVTGDPKIAFYAGAPLRASDGSKLGALCVMARQPRTFDASQVELLEQLSQFVIAHLEMRLELIEATAAKNQLRAVIDASPSPIVTVSRAGRVASWNGAAVRTFGWSEREIFGQIAPFVPAAFEAESESLRARVIDGGECVRDFPALRTRKDGSTIDVSLSGAPILDRAGVATGAVFVIEDVTRARRAREIERYRYDVLELAANDAPLEQILERLVRSVEFSIPGAETTIMLLGCDRLEHAASSAGMPAAFLERIAGLPIGPAVGSCGTAAFHGETVIVADIARDDLWRDYRELAAQHGIGACWSTPIRSGQGRVLGTLAFYFEGVRSPEPDELRFAHEAAHVASIAIESCNARAKVEDMALHDPLTGLPNRTLFENRLTQAIETAKRSGKRLAFGLLDLDRFKLVNDHLGHAVGDQLLREVASRLQRAVRPQDTIARMGGDEFLLLVTDVDDRGAACQVAHRFIGSLEQSFAPGGHEVFVRASMGLCLYPDDATEPTQLLSLADRAMYDAKASGQSVWSHDDSEQTDGIARLELEAHLNRALENGEFHLAYQPQVSVATGEVVASEALLRWENGRLGAMMPDDFIAIAEETGLIIPIGAWVVQEACRFARRWADAGGPGVVAVNVSPRQFEERHFVEMVCDAVRAAGIEPRQLRLEITENVIVRSPEMAAATLRELKAFGVSSVIDDFGVGYSSLSYLKRFPIAGLKIDRAFLRGIAEDAADDDEAIVRAILAIGRALGLEVVAEGVETAAQLQFLRANACDVAQGYHFAHPLGADAMVRWQPT